MLRKKMTQRALDANRLNGKLAKGPRTKEGKARSSRNAIQTGFFGRLHYVAEADRESYERLKVGIEQQLQPVTVLQRLQADVVIDAAWRCRLSSELDAKYLNRRLSQPDTDIPAPPKLPITQWYGTNRRTMRQALAFIDFLIPQVGSAKIPAGAAEDIKRAFGPEFYESLVEWESSDYDALLLAHNMVEKAKMFDMDLQFVEQKRKADNEDHKKAKAIPQPPEYVPVKVVKDPLERADMMRKLLAQKKEQLLEMLRLLKHVDGDAAGQQISEPPCRYVAWSLRQFEKALASYLRLREAGL